ncbi:MAG: glycine betaine ABC transporter substrate-binding protein [Thermoanaerobaculia bacterium]|nr:glycine betaine ABC transporter substrate-binding protein [Thermoanaerobaculia bacterium]
MRRALGLAALLLVALSAGAEPGRPLVVGSKSFPESRLLAEILAQLVTARTGQVVERRENLGGTLLVFKALERGEIDLYPEYTGTGWSIVRPDEAPPSDPLRVFLTVAEDFRREHGLVWRQPFGFSNSYALALRQDLASRHGITRVSQLAAHPEFRAGLSHEFLDRADGFPGLARAYGLRFEDVRGMEHGLAYEAVRSGLVDLTDAYTTDAALRRFPLIVLEDDRRFFPPYDAAPVVRAETLARHPELGPILDLLAFRISAETMQTLNDQVLGAGRGYDEVAREFLVGQGLLDDAASPDSPTASRTGSLLPFFVSRLPVTAELTLRHLALAGAGVLLAALLGIPLGILLTRWPRLAGFALGLAGVLQTVPSLALLAFLIPILGLGAPAAVAALFLYALLPIVRNTHTGIQEVDPELEDAARGLGLYDHQVLSRIELPLALPTVFAGLRTATVIAIGGATLAAFVGAGGLGDPIVTGLQLNDSRLILSGAVPAALLAIGTDFLLGRLGARLASRR